jgi:hypothetical protein
VLDEIRKYSRAIGYRHFVRGDVKPPLRHRIPTDFGDGIYAWDDNEEGLQSSAKWAIRKATPLPGSGIAVVQPIRVANTDLQNMRSLGLRHDSELPGNPWDRMVQWYRQHNAGSEMLDDYDLVSGPQAIQRNGKWQPAMQFQDQYRFLPRVQRYIELVCEVELE